MCTVPPPWIISDSSMLHSANIRTANINKLNTKCITTDSITINNDPVNGTDGVNKDYVDSKLLFEWKNPVLVATTGQQTLSGVPVSIDGYSVSSGDRVLVHLQTNDIENGIYVIDSGNWQRASDLINGEHASGVAMWVLEGTAYVHTNFVCDNLPQNDIVGTDGLTFIQFSGTTHIDPGIALELTGNILDVKTDNIDIGVNTNNELKLINTTVTQGTYGSSTQVASFTVDSRGRLTAASNVEVNTSIISSIYNILVPVIVNSLPHTLSAAELLSTYIIVTQNGNSTLTLPSVSSLYSQIGASNFVNNMSFKFSVLKTSTNTLTIVPHISMTYTYVNILTLSQHDISTFVLILNTSTSGTLLPYFHVHTV
jgi:hypothetical protein